MRVRRSIWLAVLAAGVLGTGSGWAVSDGNYDYNEQGCSGAAANSDTADRTEANCRTVIFKIGDDRHTYFSVGIAQEPDGRIPRRTIVCLAPTNVNHCVQIRPGMHRIDRLPDRPTTDPQPGKGLHFYFGADDNLDFGEHDSSEQVDNGPSDGGAVRADIGKYTLHRWLTQVLAQDKQYVLTHPLPVDGGGFGACADGLCFSAQTTQRVTDQGGASTHRDAANYDGVQWDPESCSGPDDTAEDCGGRPLGEWDAQNGTAYAEPGIQVYEDPDPQGSPVGPYPLPAFYVGTCGLVIGGGPVKAPPSPWTNSAGQIVVQTGC